MEKFISNGSNFEVLDDHKKLISRMYEFIQAIEEDISKGEFINYYTYEGSYQLIMESIVQYVKEAFNNILDGNFYTLGAINRVIVENHIYLYLIKKYKEERIWAYWIVHSLLKQAKKCNYSNMDLFYEMCEELELDINIINSEEFQKTYSNEWALPITRKTTISNLSKLVSNKLYRDYQDLCDYAHGTSIFLKIHQFTFYETFEYHVKILFIYLDKSYLVYSDGEVSEKYVEIKNEINDMFIEKNYDLEE